MGFGDWEVRLRPARCLKVAAMACGAAAMLILPVGTDPLAHAAPFSPAQLAIQSAHEAVDLVLTRRMSLDEPRRRDLAYTIVTESRLAGLDPLFVLAIIQTESRFDHEAVSPSGAKGLMQLIPRTFKAEVELSHLGRLEKFNPAHNVLVGIRYLARLARTFKRPDALLLAYNQGPGGAGAILGNRTEPSPEAATYAQKVWRSYRELLVEHGRDPRDARRSWRH